MHVDIERMKEAISERNVTFSQLAHMMQIDRSTLFRKLYEKEGLTFTIGEMHKIYQALSLTKAEACEIFLAE